jgi:hypothetical protein
VGDYQFKKSILNTYVLTCAQTTNGATAIFYPRVCKRIAELLGEDYYCVPSSIAEVVLHPVSTISETNIRRQASETVRDNSMVIGNRAMVLTGRAYRYRRETDSLEILKPYR